MSEFLRQGLIIVIKINHHHHHVTPVQQGSHRCGHIGGLR